MPPEAMIDPPAYRVVNEAGRSLYVLICEHASNFIPQRYHGLGLSSSDLQRHIAWDIGAADMALELSRLIDAPLVLANYSRLLIDLNRPPRSVTAIPVESEGTPIVGNSALSEAERAWRIDNLFTPFQSRVEALLEGRQSAGMSTRILGMHSFTPVYSGVHRPWHAGVLYRKSRDFGEALIERLGGENSRVVANEPYQIEDDSDYTVPVHGERRGLGAVLLEIRNDLIDNAEKAKMWATRVATALPAIP